MGSARIRVSEDYPRAAAGVFTSHVNTILICKLNLLVTILVNLTNIVGRLLLVSVAVGLPVGVVLTSYTRVTANERTRKRSRSSLFDVIMT